MCLEDADKEETLALCLGRLQKAKGHVGLGLMSSRLGPPPLGCRGALAQVSPPKRKEAVFT